MLGQTYIYGLIIIVLATVVAMGFNIHSMVKLGISFYWVRMSVELTIQVIYVLQELIV